jgi:hypothetical protein
MTSAEMLARICHMAVDFRNKKNVSMLELFRLSGFSGGEPIREAELAAYLRGHPELIDSWLLESVDTRYSPAWYFKPPEDGSKDWVVGYCPRTEIRKFADKYDACAFYVSRFVDRLLVLDQRQLC